MARRASATPIRTCRATALAIVHNGIIENYEGCALSCKAAGYEFQLRDRYGGHRASRAFRTWRSGGDLFEAMRATVAELEGAYALAVISAKDPERMIVARVGCPVVLGLGLRVATLLPRTSRRCCRSRAASCSWRKAMSREITARGMRIIDRDGQQRRAAGHGERAVRGCGRKGTRTGTSCSRRSTSSRAPSPTRCRNASPRAACSRRLSVRMPRRSSQRVRAVQIVACGTSYHAGLVASYLIEQLCRMPCRAEIASEYRYRNRQSSWTVRCSWRSRSRARPPIRWPHCAWRARAAIWRHWRSATRRRARWCASRSW